MTTIKEAQTRYVRKFACDVCGEHPARKADGQGQWVKIYLCKKHKKNNAGAINS